MLVGKKLPDFSLDAYEAGEQKKISSSDFQGKWMLLFFYQRDFSPLCPTELEALAKLHPQFEAEECAVVAASTDSAYSHEVWIKRDLPQVKFPLLADTSHKLALECGILLEDSGTALRGAFLADPEGIVRYETVSSLHIGRSIEELLRALCALKTGAACPAGWKKGDKTL
ncbi:MAG: peroxiredoxin [Candidatus Micrarchaeota archaeon]